MVVVVVAVVVVNTKLERPFVRTIIEQGIRINSKVVSGHVSKAQAEVEL